MVQVTDVAVGGAGGKGEGVTPEVPLEGDDGKGGHTGPDHAEGGLSTGETGVEETEAGDHTHDHGGGDDDIGLITGLIPFV